MKEKVTEEEWVRKGNQSKNDGRFEEAISFYQKAINMNSKNTTAWINKGICYEELDKLNLAIDCYERALDIDPSLERVEAYRMQTLNKIENPSPEVIRNRILGSTEVRNKEMKEILGNFEKTWIFRLLAYAFVIGFIVSFYVFIVSIIENSINWGALTTGILNLASCIAWGMIAGNFDDLATYLKKFATVKKLDDEKSINKED